MSGKRYNPNLLSMELLIDSARFTNMAHCATLVEDQIAAFDDRNATEFATDYGTMIQAAFLMITVAYMEDQLKKLCDAVAARRNIVVRSADMKGANGFDSCLAYLEKVLQLNLPLLDCNRTRAVVAIRNAWVHHGGHLTPEVLPKSLGVAAKHLKLVGGQVQFVGPFVQDACRICESFVYDVQDALQSQSGPKRHRKR